MKVRVAVYQHPIDLRTVEILAFDDDKVRHPRRGGGGREDRRTNPFTTSTSRRLRVARDSHLTSSRTRAIR